MSGDLRNSFVYVAKDTIETDEEKEKVKKLDKSRAVVPKLMRDLCDMIYRLYINNWYTEERLCHYLRENETVGCCTAMDYRLKFPKLFKVQPLAK